MPSDDAATPAADAVTDARDAAPTRRPTSSTSAAGARVAGVVTQLGIRIRARTVVLTVGTFLAGKIHVGEAQQAAGRAGDPPATTLAARLRELPFATGRLKTGTPPRLDGRSIDYAQLEAQPGDEPRPVFSALGSPRRSPAPGALSHHPDQRAHPRPDPRLPAPLAAVRGRDRGHGAALLPLDRGQGRALRRARLAPDLRRAGRARHPRGLPERHLDQPALRRADRLRALDRGGSSARGSRVRATRSSTTTSTRAACADRSRRALSPGSSSRGRSTARPATRRPPRRGSSPVSTPPGRRAARRAGRRAATRPTSGC